ncbi:LLM class F420-dependent oxidoreductase [Streptomyces sp. NPDC051132]|uniref:LLM class F420-dependent oxidoreductase n=1 Tax=unclassified Streptomyces TaxID=2593676 RepID=UPI00342F2206
MSVEFGVVTFPVYDGIAVTELARMTEDLGFESLFFTEHTHIPASRESPSPTGGELPSRYYRNLDPFIALTAAASVTERILLGTGICLVNQRDPIILAKETASLDQFARGRLVLGVGAGWNAEEMRNHGVDPATRFERMGEHVRAVKAIWTQDEATFHGTHVSFDRIWSWPKPARRPHPPVLVGGNGRHVLRRVVEYGDGWFPLATHLGQLTRQAEELRALARAAGRGPLPITLYGGLRTPEEIPDYAAAGVTRILIPVTAGPTQQVRDQLEQTARMLDGLLH